MICVKLEGGLGNQMFQYAAGRALAQRHNTDLILDTAALNRTGSKYTARDFELKHFRVKSQLSSPEDFRLIRLLHRFPRLVNLFSNWRLYVEDSLSFNVAFKELPDSTYLSGYWQSFLYFSDFAKNIYEDFQPTEELSQFSKEISHQIISCESVSLHVRRGDYVTLKSAANMHGTLAESYYSKAIEHVFSSLANPVIFIFSDDPDWCKANLIFPFGSVRYVNHNVGSAAWQDLMLMSQCRHNIIANSSFSWWGAWLADQRYGINDRFVYAPNKWFAGIDNNIIDRIPKHWILIK